MSADYDVIIIGSGAGGGTLAHQLAPPGKRILILERGDWLKREAQNWDPTAVFVDNRYISPDTWYDHDGKAFQPQVHYFVGGATKMYGAALYRLRKEDFEEIREYDGISPAWPISYDDFEPYYTRAEQFVAIFVALGAWWLLPVTVAVALLAVLLLVSKNPFRSESHRTGAIGHSKSTGLASLPARLWLYAALVLLYGVVETLNGNWATIYLGGKPGISARGASLGLTAFWATVTAGRIFFSALSRRISVRWIYIGLPMFLIVAFPLVAQVQSEIEGILAFAFAGLACSAFLPLSISLGGREFTGLSTLVSGELIAFYQVGYGVAAFGVGPLRDLTGLSFSRILSLGSIAAGAMVVLAWLVIRRAESHCSQLAP